jgi:hypothetical protein
VTEDKNTELPGKQESEVIETPAQASDPKKPTSPSGERTKPVKQAPKPADDDEDGDNTDDGEIIKLTQGQLNDMLSKRAEKARRKVADENTELRKQIEALSTERDQYRVAEVTKVKEQFEKLPEDVRAMAPFALDKITEGDTFAQATAWLPKAQALAEKLGGNKEAATPTEKKVVPAGNKPAPKPVSNPSSTDDATQKAKSQMRKKF